MGAKLPGIDDGGGAGGGEGVQPEIQLLQQAVCGLQRGGLAAMGLQRGGGPAGDFRGVHEVDADADDQPAEQLALGGGVDQDARQLGAIEKDVVRPFQLRRDFGGQEGRERVSGGDAGQQREDAGLGGGKVRAQENGEVEVASNGNP